MDDEDNKFKTEEGSDPVKRLLRNTRMDKSNMDAKRLSERVWESRLCPKPR